MYEYEQIFHNQEMYNMYSKGEVKPLDDLYGIEDFSLEIKKTEKKIEFYKGYKKKKREDIDNEIKVLENKIEFFKKVILKTLEHHKEKSVNFPGSCSITSRKNPVKWSILDEEKFIKVLEQAKEKELIKEEDFNDVIEIKTQYIIKKREAGNLLTLWEKNGNLEEFEENCVKKEPVSKGLSFKYEEEKEEVEEDMVDETAPVEEEVSVSEEDFDAI